MSELKYTATQMNNVLSSSQEYYRNWREAEKINKELHARISELSQAVGLITTLKPTMVMDTEHPLDMAKEVAEYVTARIAELEAAQARWVMASERLPEENQQILSTDGKEFYLDYYARWEGKDNPPCFCDGLSWAVTHWMPLPEYPNDTQSSTIVYGKERK